MQRHSDRKAYLAERQRQSLQWSGGRIRDGDGDVDGNNSEGNNNGRPPDRSSGDDGATFASQELHPPHHSATLLPGRSTPRSGASPRLEKEQESPVLSLSSGPSDGKGNGKGRLVPVGEHHEGSFGVYMAHKMEKLRDQVDGAVTRLEGQAVALRAVALYAIGFAYLKYVVYFKHIIHIVAASNRITASAISLGGSRHHPCCCQASRVHIVTPVLLRTLTLSCGHVVTYSIMFISYPWFEVPYEAQQKQEYHILASQQQSTASDSF